MQQRFSPHDWAAVFRVVAASVARATRDARHLRATCRTAQLGYDCAVQAGWIPLAGHRAGEPEEEGATCMWINGWFPVSVKDFSDDNLTAGVVVRLEHRLVLRRETAVMEAHDIVWYVPQLIVAETEQPAVENGSAFDNTVLDHVKPARVTRFRLAATTKALTRAMPPYQRGDHHATVDSPSSLKYHVFASLHLVAFDTSGLGCIRHVTDGFLRECSALTSVNLTGFRSVVSVGPSFLSRCTALRSVDLTPLASVTTISSAFMDYCTALTTLNTAGLSSVTEIGSAFCYGASALTTVDVRGLTAVTKISERWLGQCIALEDFRSRSPQPPPTSSNTAPVDAAPFGRLREIGPGFMVQCTGLKVVDLSGFTSVDLINAEFLGQCTSLESFSSEGLGQVRVLGTGFLSRCSSLASIETSGFTQLRTVGAGFLYGCCTLQSVSTTGLGNVTVIRSHFLHEATSLHRFDASGLTSLTSLGSDCLGGCWYLEEIDLSATGNVAAVGVNCFKGVPRAAVVQSAAKWPSALRTAYAVTNDDTDL